MLCAGGAHAALVTDIAAHLGVSITPRTAHTSANGEAFVRFGKSVRGSDAFVFQASTEPVNNTWMLET